MCSAMSSRVGHYEHFHVGLTNAELPSSDVTGTKEACSLEEKHLEWLCGWRVRRMLGRGGSCRFRVLSTALSRVPWNELRYESFLDSSSLLWNKHYLPLEPYDQLSQPCFLPFTQKLLLYKCLVMTVNIVTYPEKISQPLWNNQYRSKGSYAGRGIVKYLKDGGWLYMAYCFPWLRIHYKLTTTTL